MCHDISRKKLRHAPPTYVVRTGNRRPLLRSVWSAPPRNQRGLGDAGQKRTVPQESREAVSARDKLCGADVALCKHFSNTKDLVNVGLQNRGLHGGWEARCPSGR